MMATEAAQEICEEDTNLNLFNVNVVIRNLKEEAKDDSEESGVDDGEVLNSTFWYFDKNQNQNKTLTTLLSVLPRIKKRPKDAIFGIHSLYSTTSRKIMCRISNKYFVQKIFFKKLEIVLDDETIENI